MFEAERLRTPTATDETAVLAVLVATGCSQLLWEAVFRRGGKWRRVGSEIASLVPPVLESFPEPRRADQVEN